METEKIVANNIDCPKCQSENCFMNDDARSHTDGSAVTTQGVSIHCKECGFSSFQAYEYDEDGFCDLCNEDKPTRNIKKDEFHRIDVCRGCSEEMS